MEVQMKVEVEVVMQDGVGDKVDVVGGAAELGG